MSITQQPTNSVNKKSVSFNCDTISRIWTENVGFPRAQVHHTEVAYNAELARIPTDGAHRCTTDRDLYYMPR